VRERKKERKQTTQTRDRGGGQGPHLHEQDFGRTIKGTQVGKKKPTRSQGALPTRRSSTTTTTPAPSQSASGATSASSPTTPPTTPPPTATHAAPAPLARRMTYSTPSKTISATVPTPASASSRQAAEPKSLCVPHFLLASKNLSPRWALLLLTRDTTTGSQRGARWNPNSTGGLISV